MIYTHHTGENFKHLIQAFREVQVSEQNIETAVAYLHLENPRDNSLLDSIQPQIFPQIFSYHYGLETAVRKDIVQTGSDELLERYILIVHAIAGGHLTKLGVSSIYYNRDQLEDLLRKAFASRFGEDAESVMLVYQLTQLTYHNMKYAVRKVTDPEICLKALQYTEDYCIRVILVIMIFSSVQSGWKSLSLPFMKNKQQEIIKKALQELDSLLQNKSKYPDHAEYLIVAIAIASMFDKNYFNMFQQEIQHKQSTVAALVLSMPIHKDSILDVMDKVPSLRYIGRIANATNDALPTRDNHLKTLAKHFPDMYCQQMEQEKDPYIAKHMEDILKKENKNYQLEVPLQEKAQRRCAHVLSSLDKNMQYEIEKYLLGMTSTEEFLEIEPKLEKNKDNRGNNDVDYIVAYGIDDFAERCICYQAIANCGYVWSHRTPGFKIKSNEKQLIQTLRKNHMPIKIILNMCSNVITSIYSTREKEEAEKRVVESCKDFADEIAQTATDEMFVEARCLRVRILGEINKSKYQTVLFAATADSSKTVRNLLVNYLPLPDETVQECLLALLYSKKLSQREVAVQLLERKCPAAWQKTVQNAFDTEKNEKLKSRLGELIGADSKENMQKSPTESLVENLTKGTKSKKTEWLFKTAFTPVRNQKQEEVSEKYLQALLYCYASMTVGNYARSDIADKLAEDVYPADLERFAEEVFSRWLDKGAEAKTKWVIYFAGIHGGMPMIQTLQHYIKTWAEHARGAIASEAVKAMAYNGSSSALLLVDDMARKFKNKQVRNAANAALQQAAETLGITREELADKIIPDLGFDENRCRIFDYGTRQFHVYMTPALELEIYEGEKKLKNFPKPSAKDDTQKAEQASKAFKDMKKQMKTVVQSQKARLEYVLLCDRKWSVERWKELFIQKPIMHNFAISLIWGAYQHDMLVQTFRYMEDGSFNTVDEEEYVLPEDMQIGLVHPLELDEETRLAWQEQLSDYEITQPFAQLTRPVYKLLDNEKDKTEITRFVGKKISIPSLMHKMGKYGWSKGYAEDAGIFFNFNRVDIARQEKQDNTIKRTGYYAELQFSGCYIAASYYDYDAQVEIDKVRIWSLENLVKEENTLKLEPLKLEKVNARYFSELMAQLTSIFGEEEKK